MLVDDRKHIIQLTIRKEFWLHENMNPKSILNSFQGPKLNFEAEKYIDSFDWLHSIRVEPIVTKSKKRQRLVVINEETAS